MSSFIKPTSFAVLITVLLAFPAGILAKENPNDILIIVNNTLPEHTIPIDIVRSVFLGKRTNWQSGIKITPINAPVGSKLRNDFRKEVLQMSEPEETRYWEERIIKYGGKKMATLSSSLKAVFMLKGAISYIYRSSYKEKTAKIVLVIPADSEGEQ